MASLGMTMPEWCAQQVGSIRLCRLDRVYLLYIGERFAYLPEGYRPFVRCTLYIAVCLYQTV